MLVTALSGTTVAQLDEEEFLHMVERGKTIRDLKQLLSVQVGCSRFQQRLFSDEVELQDDMPLRPLPSLQLVVLPFCASDPGSDRERELLDGCRYNKVIDVERLLQEPQDPNGYVYLDVAAKNGHLEVVRLLLEAGANKERKGKTGATALILAAETGRLEVVRLLLQAGADKDAANENGKTALILAAEKGHLEVVQLLLEAGADQDSAMTGGATALMLAAQNGKLEVVRMLLEAGAAKDAATTALMIAAKKGQTEVVRLLLEAGADRDAAISDPRIAFLISLMERSWSRS